MEASNHYLPFKVLPKHKSLKFSLLILSMFLHLFPFRCFSLFLCMLFFLSPSLFSCLSVLLSSFFLFFISFFLYFLLIFFSHKPKCNVYTICRQTQLSTRWYANLLNVNLIYMFRPQSLAIIRLYKRKLIN